MSTFLDLDVDLIDLPKDQLRTVNKEAEKYHELVDSVKRDGVLQNINVREAKDDTGTSTGRYILVNGGHRLAAVKDCELKQIPANILDAEELDSMVLSIVTNTHTIETSPSDITKMIQKILNLNPALTLAEVGTMMSKSSAWVVGRLSLKHLNEAAMALTDEGKITIANASGLAKLSEEEQVHWLERAQTDDSVAFNTAVLERKRELNAIARAGGPVERKFEAKAVLRKRADIEAMLAEPKTVSAFVKATKPANHDEAVVQALKWTLSLDPVSVKAQQDKWDADEAKKADDKIVRDRERAKKKQKEAEENAATAKKEAEEADKAYEKAKASA